MGQNDESAKWPEPAPAGARRSVLASDLAIEGVVVSRGPVDVQGKVIGSVRAPEVLIATSGTVDGSITALDLSVLGVISGTVEVRNASLAATSVVHADIIHERIAIEAGAQIDGKLQRRA